MSTSAEIIDGQVPVCEHDPPTSTDGAILRFVGIVRALEGNRPLKAIRYETYDPMAQKQLALLANRAVEQFDLNALRLIHSRGEVPVGHPSLLVDIYSTHRREGLDAMDWVIATLKQDVPIWKHPIYSNPLPEDSTNA